MFLPAAENRGAAALKARNERREKECSDFIVCNDITEISQRQRVTPATSGPLTAGMNGHGDGAVVKDNPGCLAKRGD